MHAPRTRREFLAATALTPAVLALVARAADVPVASRLLFTSQGRTGLVTDDGAVRYLDLNRPNQVTWQPGPAFDDGRRIVLLSMEPRRDGPGRPFAEYYTQTPTHIWIFDFADDSLREICTRDRLAPFETPALLLSDERMLVQVVREGVGQIYNMRLDGSDARAFTRAGEGLPYGLSLSPDGRRVAFHLASPQGYQVWTSDTEGRDRTRVAADGEHLYFGTSWSPDGEWILYVDCRYRDDPGHDWADVCIGRADGSAHRVLTSGQAMWFAATYGNRETKGGGSNVPAWTPEGTILYPRRTPGARVAWQYQPDRADVDHFNRDFLPGEARGGTQIVRLDPVSGAETALTPSTPGVWDFRATALPDGRQIAFCRVATGQPPSLWIMNADGSHPRRITTGIDGQGADHPRWV
ncbi:MAG: serine/threonine protein kinase [Planctomycetota bacterium]|nr:MAG: serine/threonine protein kinase [Planctomycetota bacterium]